MQVILLERVENLGVMGDIVEVKSGYARNFLLPKKKALRAIEANIEFFKTQKIHLEAVNIKRRSEAETIAEKMNKVMVSVVRQASEAGHLYGSVRTQDVAIALDQAGYTVLHSQIDLPKPIKTLGFHKALIVLHPEIIVSIDVSVAQSEEEAALIVQNLAKAAKAAAKATAAAQPDDSGSLVAAESEA